MFEEHEKYGFIVIDGNGCLFGTLCGNTKEVLHQFSVDLPKKHGRGGQSALRFARLRMEKRHNFVTKCSELATQYYLDKSRGKCTVSGLVLAGSASFKTDLLNSNCFDPKLRKAVVRTVDVGYGSMAGFNEVL
jgi:peptide chain release factor subunit 1